LAIVEPALSQTPGVHLCEPLDYLALVQVLADCDLVLTDSGGLQEEAPTFGKPVLVLRETTERPEAIEAGVARLVGTEPAAVYAAAAHLLDNGAAYAAMARAGNPFGDGTAARRIARALAEPYRAAEAA
jgi:UDP-N-acetylglucosamine 2-epimerase (non-hydrolysing)